jgi:signal transduction histidine kinase
MNTASIDPPKSIREEVFAPSAIEPAFDDLACQAIEICGTRIAVLCLGAARRIVFSADANFTVADIPRAEVLCELVRNTQETVVTCDPTSDARFAHETRVMTGPDLRFFAGAPLFDARGEVAGVVCVLDFDCREFTAAQQAALQLLARLASTRLQLQQVAADRARMQAELQTLKGSVEERIEKRTEQLQAANAELESFACSVAHELSTPLRVIEDLPMRVIETEALNLSPGAEHKLRMVHERAGQMQRLIRHLLTFSRSSHRPVQRQKINPTELVSRLMEEFRDRHPGRTILFRLNALPDCEADPALLRHVFVNLISNAIKFTAPRDVSVIEIGSVADEDVTAFYVRDNGLGFDLCYARRLFGAFQQLHNTTRFEGFGVGLSLVRRIVQRHGGRIWAESEPGKGATFQFTLGKSQQPSAPSQKPIAESLVVPHPELALRLAGNKAS